MRSAWLGLVLAVSVTGCFPDVDPSGLPSIADYTSWDSIEVESNVPAHGDSRRVMYRNTFARQYTGAGRYRPGAVIGKEIYNPDSGKLRYRAVMRKVEGLSDYDLGGAEVDGGWVFTYLDTDDSERYLFSCWDSCHRQATYDGAWLDHGF